jgi:predicted RNase H-like nuclease (RuvC/YqgF family)
MMTLDEAIEHAEWCADNSCGECAEEHRQLAEWLRRLQALRAAVSGLERMRDQLMAEVHGLRSERARYEELAHILDREWNIEVEWDGLRKIWYVGLTELGVRLRDEREAVRMAQTETINELVDKNEKLRKLLQGAVNELLDDCGDCWGGLCEECECWVADSEGELRALGIEVES